MFIMEHYSILLSEYCPVYRLMYFVYFLCNAYIFVCILQCAEKMIQYAMVNISICTVVVTFSICCVFRNQHSVNFSFKKMCAC